MNKILCFDVSHNSCSVAIALGQEILSFEQDMRPSIQAETLMVMIHNALKNTSNSYNDIDYLAVTTGPGSFTGIRIGLSAAKGILYASNIKPISVNNFEIAHYRLMQQLKQCFRSFILINAYRDQVYIQEFIQNQPKGKPQLIDNLDAVNILKKQKEPIACAGSGIEAIYKDIKNINNITILPRFRTIKALHIARFADNQINKGIFQPIEPLYIRPPDAVIPSK